MKKMVKIIKVVIAIIFIAGLLPVFVLADDGANAITMPIGTKIVLAQDAVATFEGKTPAGDYQWTATFGKLQYLADLKTPIDCRWRYLEEIEGWISGANVFTATVNKSFSTVNFEGESMTWQPDLYIGGKLEYPGVAMTIGSDPLNENYYGNTLQWTYPSGITWNLRLIEGVLQEYYVIPEMPAGDIAIKNNISRTNGFRGHRIPIAWDNTTKPVELKVDNGDIELPLNALKGITFPVIIDPDMTYTETAADGWVSNSALNNWTAAHDNATGENSGTTGVNHWVDAGTWGSANNTVYAIDRIFLYFDTTALPDSANITNVVLSLYRPADFTYTSNVSVQKGTQADNLTTADYSSFSGSLYGYVSWSPFNNYKNITFNAAGIADINKAGITKLCVREYNHDYLNVSPVYDYTYLNYINLYERGAGYYPLLTITYSATAAPTIQTNDATQITYTTARLNSYLVDDGGEPCDVRFEYDTDTGSPYANATAWINDTYYSGDSPFADIANLTPGTTYYFRVQAVNSKGLTNGSELNFNTSASLQAPSSFKAYPSNSSIALTWIKGYGATTTIIRGKLGDYPLNYTDGIEVYNGSQSTTTWSGLTSGTSYYLKAWGASGGNISTANTTLLTTTSAGITEGDEGVNAPTTPGGWWLTPDYTRLSNLGGFYNLTNTIADEYSIPRNTFWVVGILLFIMAIGMFVYSIKQNIIAALTIVSVMIFVFSVAHILPLFMVAAIGIPIAAGMLHHRRV